MKLKTKLILLAAVPLLGLAVTVVTFYLRTNALGKAVHLTTTESAVYADLARKLQVNVIQVQQFFSDVSATRALDGLDDGFKNAAEQQEQFKAGAKRFQEMFESEHDAARLKEITAVQENFAAYYEVGHNMATAYVKDGPAGGNKLMPDFDKAADQLDQTLGTFVKEQTDEFTGSLTAVEASSLRTTVIVLFGGLGLTIGTILLAFYSIRSITTSLRTIASQVAENANCVSASASELSSASQTVAEGASEQAASLEETSASLEEIAAMTKRNAESAAGGATLSKKAREDAHGGLDKISELSRTLDSIKTAVAEMQAAVAESQSSSQQVSKIIKTIDEIAFQTNLLALNAAVEAARAGEAGMGFAVVADEVRALAQRSAQAAKDTSEKIEVAVKRSELGAVASTKVVKSLIEVESSAQSIQQVFAGIVTEIKSLDAVIAQISSASQEQTSGMHEVNMAVSQMDKVTQSNAAAAEENAGAASTLNGQSNHLLQAVNALEALIEGQSASSSGSGSGKSAATQSHSIPTVQRFAKKPRSTTMVTRGQAATQPSQQESADAVANQFQNF